MFLQSCVNLISFLSSKMADRTFDQFQICPDGLCPYTLNSSIIFQTVNPLVRAKAPSNLVVTSISSNSGPALSQEKDTDKSFEREEGSNCKDNTGIRLIPKSISTTKIVLTEKADNFTFQVFSGTTTPFYLSASPHTRATTPDYSRK